jgi:hypothetical protein
MAFDVINKKTFGCQNVTGSLHFTGGRRAALCAIAIFSGLVGSGCGGGAADGAPPLQTQAVTLTWTMPTLNTDGTALVDAAGYRVDYGVAAANLTVSTSVSGAGNTTATITGLSGGTYYFAVTTLNAAGAASSRSDIASKTLP